MQIQNLTTHCLQSWKDRGAQTLRPSLLNAARTLAPTLHAAPKFVLPEGGRVIEDAEGIARIYPGLRFPYPVQVLEFQAKGVIAQHEVRSSKRLSIVWDSRQGGRPTEILDRFLMRPHAEDPVFIQSIFYIDHLDAWVVNPGLSELLLDETPLRMRPTDLPNSELHLVQHRLPGDFARPCFPVAWHLYEEVPLAKLDAAICRVSADGADELEAALAFGAITACANIRAERIEPDAKLNRKKAKSGKVPAFPVHVLHVENGAYTAAPSKGNQHGAGHASPRTHLRRGHIRRLIDRNVWVNSAVVNHGKSPSLERQYQIRNS